MLAAQNRYVETCKLLLEHIANADDKSNQGRTVLHLVVYKGRVEMYVFLLECGIDDNNNYDKTPPKNAKDGGHGENMKLCTLLQNRGAD